MFAQQQSTRRQNETSICNNQEQICDDSLTTKNVDVHQQQKDNKSQETSTFKTTINCPTALKLDAQEFYDIHEDDLVDFDTAEEFLLHFSRVGQEIFVEKLITLRNKKEIALNIDCKGTSKANHGWSSLHLATYFGHSNVVEILLKNGADVNIQNEEGDTPLHKAAYTSRENIVIQLLAHNANVFIQNGDSLRPFELAKSDSIRKLLSAAELSDIKRREERFLSAARSGDVFILKELLEDINCVNINCVDSSGNSALHCAAYRGQNEAVIFLLKNGIDTSLKNNRGQLAAHVATTISLKQLIQEAHLSVMTPKVVASLKNKSVQRFEGFLLKKGKFFGWRMIWAVLERGVFSFFNNRADAANGIRRKGYKYLENAMTEVVIGQNQLTNTIQSTNNACGNNQQQMDQAFIIIFGDRSKAMFSLAKGQTELDLQKWISAINDHIYFSTNFIKQGTHIGDSDDEDEAAKQQLLSSISIQDMILTANAHQKILERHINALQQLLDDESLFTTNEQNREDQLSNNSFHSYHSIDSISKSTIPSIKFHLNLILESSKNANTSLTQCLVLVSHQNQSRQVLIQHEQEKVRALEEALHLLAREHHDLERSITLSIQHNQQHPNATSPTTTTMAESAHLSNSTNLVSINKSFKRSFACLSTASTTDVDEYFDAFDDDEFDHDGMVDGGVDHVSDKTVSLSQIDNLSDKKINCSTTNLSLVKMTPTVSASFHTAQQDQLNTINDSISTLSPDETDKTIASDDLPYSRDRLPSAMVPRDEVGLWSILKHCIGKELSKITFPVIFNEPLSFLQRTVEMFQYSHYLNIADQCDDLVERMENISAFIVSAYSSNWLRLNKPFNPLLGETFEYEIASSQTKVVCEQVSHHPPISAWYAESPHFIFRSSSAPKLRFWGKSIEVKPEGSMTLELKSKHEVYTWKSVNCCVHNIIVGKLWFEHYGTIEVHNRMNNHKIVLNFKPAGWFGYDLNRFDGCIQNENKEKLRFLYGKWNDYIKSASIEDYEDYMKSNNNKFRAPDKPIEEPTTSATSSTSRKMMSKLNSLTKQLAGSLDISSSSPSDQQTSSTMGPADVPENLPPEDLNGEIPKSDSSHSLDISNSRILWKAIPRPENSAQYYNFNSFTFGLNELPEDIQEKTMLINKLPKTDSRFRPDIRKLEEGDLDGAALEKNRLEEKQRETRRLRKKGKMKEFEPMWFRLETNKYTGNEEWTFTKEYWKQTDWSKCPDIF